MRDLGEVAQELGLARNQLEDICSDEGVFLTGTIRKSGGSIVLDQDAIEEIKEELERREANGS